MMERRIGWHIRRWPWRGRGDRQSRREGIRPDRPDVEGARRRFPDWTFWQEGRSWLAKRNDMTVQLTGLSLESLEGNVARAEKERARQEPPPADKPA
jgi:hypothetical protein